MFLDAIERLNICVFIDKPLPTPTHPEGRFNGGFFTLSLWGAYICTVRRIL